MKAHGKDGLLNEFPDLWQKLLAPDLSGRGGQLASPVSCVTVHPEIF